MGQISSNYSRMCIQTHVSQQHFDTILITLTVAGRSQHLSRLIQLKLQIISNIWSWNCTEENIHGDAVGKADAHSRDLGGTTNTQDSVPASRRQQLRLNFCLRAEAVLEPVGRGKWRDAVPDVCFYFHSRLQTASFHLQT